MSHRNSKTPAEVKIVKLGGAYADVRRKDLIDRKLEVLRRIQAGEDPDAVGLAAMRVVFQEDRAIEDEGSFWVMYQEDSIVEDESSFWVTFEDEASVREMFQEERDIEASFFEGFTDASLREMFQVGRIIEKEEAVNGPQNVEGYPAKTATNGGQNALLGQETIEQETETIRLAKTDPNRAHYQAYLKTNHWKMKREEALNYYGRKCRLCGKPGEEITLQVHHIGDEAYQYIGSEVVSRDLTVLCEECHSWHHRKPVVERRWRAFSFNPRPPRRRTANSRKHIPKQFQVVNLQMKTRPKWLDSVLDPLIGGFSAICSALLWLLELCMVPLWIFAGAFEVPARSVGFLVALVLCVWLLNWLKC